jgi:quercetin dioxygenase-like cupin family protein
MSASAWTGFQATVDEMDKEPEHRHSNPQGFSCDIDSANVARQRERGPQVAVPTESRVHRFHDNYTWEGVVIQPYKRSTPVESEETKPSDWAEAIRQVIVGTADERTDFHLRYFELAPNGHTSLEKHEHAHVVIAIRGTGKVIAGHHCWELDFLDAAYIAPWTPHQFLNDGSEPFGFFCIVDAIRDHPQSLSEWEREHITQDEEVRKLAKF